MKRSSKSLENEFEKPWKIQFQKKENFFSLLFFGLLATFLARLEAARAASLAHHLGLPSPSLWLTSWSRAIYR